jgi:hypothetical protein
MLAAGATPSIARRLPTDGEHRQVFAQLKKSLRLADLARHTPSPAFENETPYLVGWPGRQPTIGNSFVTSLRRALSPAVVEWLKLNRRQATIL